MNTFNGEHRFKFEPSKTTPGHTTFIHEENFTGAMTWMMNGGMASKMVGLEKSTREGFEKFNADLKAWCEKA